jgi:hypothetical protein
MTLGYLRDYELQILLGTNSNPMVTVQINRKNLLTWIIWATLLLVSLTL